MIFWYLAVLISSKIWRKITRDESLLFSLIFLRMFNILEKYFNKNLFSKISLENFLICIIRHFQRMTFTNVFCYFLFFWGIYSRSSAANRTEPNMWALKCPLKPDSDLWKLKNPEEPASRKKNWNKLNIVQCIYTIDRKIQKDWLSNLIVFAG